MGVWAHLLACIPNGRGPQFLLWRSDIPRAGWQVHLPQGPALGDHTSDHIKSTSPLPLGHIQCMYKHPFKDEQVVQYPDIPTGGIHPGIILHLGNVLPPRWRALLSLPAP